MHADWWLRVYYCRTDLRKYLFPPPPLFRSSTILPTALISCFYWLQLNPEGPMGIPIPNSTAETVRDAFGRMGMNDSETVALIGGGHAFGESERSRPLIYSRHIPFLLAIHPPPSPCRQDSWSLPARSGPFTYRVPEFQSVLCPMGRVLWLRQRSRRFYLRL